MVFRTPLSLGEQGTETGPNRAARTGRLTIPRPAAPDGTLVSTWTPARPDPSACCATRYRSRRDEGTPVGGPRPRRARGRGARGGGGPAPRAHLPRPPAPIWPKTRPDDRGSGPPRRHDVRDRDPGRRRDLAG